MISKQLQLGNIIYNNTTNLYESVTDIMCIGDSIIVNGSLEITGVPLSSNVLTRLNFQKLTMGSYCIGDKNHNRYVLNRDSELLISSCNGNYIFGNTLFVHELQNIYFHTYGDFLLDDDTTPEFVKFLNTDIKP